ncbi:MAG: aminotransferase class V-fold PLP-dependent enzyme [Chitinophagaceae bacterium]|nr:aminotransferase class V-fold PLP-dependent enzyme [Chitinophagaceae bacterium]
MHPENISSQNKRRKFLKQFSAASLAALTPSAWATATQDTFAKLPLLPLQPDEQYWEMVKQQFTVPPNLIMVNAANLCPSPYFISEQVNSFTKNLGRDVSFQFRATLAEKRNKALAMMAQFLSVSKEELGITRNTSESNAIVVNSLDFKQGDEVIIWDQNHPSANAAVELRAKRYGFIVKKVTVPPSPASPDELIAPFAKAITVKTRLMAFSHISNTSGIALPVKQLCKLTNEKNILSLIDGAQSFGLLDMNLQETGCDFYTASTHKWLMGPMENGILYIKKESANHIWPNIIGGGWKESNAAVDERICMLGQRNDATAAALPDIIEFHYRIGKKNIENRVVQLNTCLKQQIQNKIPQASFVTPLSPAISAGIVIVNIPGKEPASIYQKLYEQYGIACAATGGIRFSPHIYNTMADIDKIAAALKKLSA